MKKSVFALLLAFLILVTGCSQTASKMGDLYGEYLNKNVYTGIWPVERLSGMAEDPAVLGDDPVANVNATAALLISETDRKVLLQKNPTAKIYPASMTKCMTALLVLEKVQDLGAEVTVTKEAYEGLSEDASLANLKVGGVYTVRDLLYALMLPSGNEAANALALYVGGSIADFAVLMNERALDLGMLGTHFQNPHGLHSKNHYTTVYDLYLLFRRCMEIPEFLEIIGTEQYMLSCRIGGKTETETIKNTNSYLRGYATLPEGFYPLGGKTGYTVEAGRCLIFLSADAAGKRYISVVAHATTYTGAYDATNALLESIPHD